MADRYVQEGVLDPPIFTDGYLLEDGSGVLLLEVVEPIVLAVDAAAFDVDGQDVVLNVGAVVSSASISPTGQSVFGEAVASHDPAAFDIDGQEIALTIGTPIAVDSAAFDVDGQSVAFNTSILVDAAAIQPAGQTIPMDSGLLVSKADLQPAGQVIDLIAAGDTPVSVDSAALSVIGSEIGLTLSDTAQETFSGGWIESAYEREYDRFIKKLKKDLEEESERQELADRLEKVLVQEGSLTQAQADLIRLRGIASEYRSNLPNRARRALAFAERAQSEFAAKLALRELERARQEEELAVLLLMALD